MESLTNYIVNTNNLVSNVSKIRRIVPRSTYILGVVKANAYGVGLQTVCQAIHNYVDYFGVACVYEAKCLREFDSVTPILILGEVNLSEVKWCSEHNVCVTISCIEELKYIDSLMFDSVVKVHLAINTGLNRIGFSSVTKYRHALTIIKKSTKIELVGVFTHFATKSNDIRFIEAQYNNFAEYLKYTPKNVIRHCCNSYAAMCDNRFYLDMVRVGFGMYGNVQVDGYNFDQVVSITSTISFIQHVKCNSTIGYDRIVMATRNMRVAVVPIGYADGLDRRLSNNFSFLINGKRCNIVGNICMDVCLVDVTDVKNVFVGTQVVILGDSGNDSITLSNFADTLSTSPYEILLKWKYTRMNYIVK